MEDLSLRDKLRFTFKLIGAVVITILGFSCATYMVVTSNYFFDILFLNIMWGVTGMVLFLAMLIFVAFIASPD